jgi:hypothetical protein
VERRFGLRILSPSLAGWGEGWGEGRGLAKASIAASSTLSMFVKASLFQKRSTR